MTKFDILKAMNTLVITSNDENFYFNHWIWIIPDQCDDDELRDIAENQEAIFKDAVTCFINNFPKYSKSGLFIENKLYN